MKIVKETFRDIEIEKHKFHRYRNITVLSF